MLALLSLCIWLYLVFGHGRFWRSVPTLLRYKRSALWSLVLPLIALFYMSATVASAVNYWLGSGARWKSRDYGERD